MFTYTWTLSDPDHWLVQYSADGVSGWATDQTVIGSARGFNGMHAGQYYRLAGFSLVGVQLSDWSNVVRATT